MARPDVKSLAALMFACIATAAMAQSYPSRSVTIVVPFPPGGGTDTGARIVAQKLSQKWGQPVIVENKGGAAGMLGADQASKAKPDGYTLLMGNIGTQSINPTLYGKRMTYNPDTAFTPVTLVAELPLVLLAGPAMPAKSASELIARLAEEGIIFAFARERLAVVLFEIRLVIKRIDMADTARGEDMHNPLGFAGKVWRLGNIGRFSRNSAGTLRERLFVEQPG